MAETGVLPPDARVELLEGEIIDMSPRGPFHGGVTKFLNAHFAKQSRERYLVSVQDPLHLSDVSEPRPDLMLLKVAPGFYATRHPEPEDVFLLVEVCDTSLDYDRDRKLPLYAPAGVPEVWLVNLAEQSLEIYHDPRAAGYHSSAIRQTGDHAQPRAFPDVIDVGALFKRG